MLRSLFASTLLKSSTFRASGLPHTSFLSSASSSSTTKHEAKQHVKKHLRRLYYHIHPDRLTQFPKERLVNESSFQQLQSALDPHLKPSTQPGNEHEHHSNKPSRSLTFFANHPEDNSKGLIEASITFHESRIAAAVIDLFKALGLNDPPSVSTLHVVFPVSKVKSSSTYTGGYSGGYSGKTTGVDLRQMADEARKQRNPFSVDPDTAAKVANATSTPDEKRILQHALQRKYGIVIEILEDARSHSLILLRRLAGVLRFLDEQEVSLRPAILQLHAGRRAATVRAKCDLNAASSEVGGESLVPVVGLGALAPDAEWRNAVECRDVAAGCERTRTEVQQLHVLQVAVARRIGVRLILCEVAVEAARTEEDVQLVRRYEKLLRELLSSSSHDADGRAKEQVERMRRLVAVMVGAGDNSVEADEDNGVIKVGIKGGPGAVREAVRKGTGMARRFERVCAERDADARATETVRRELRVERLRRVDGAMTDAQWKAALQRLRRHRRKLSDVLAGVSVAVGDSTRVLSGGEVQLAHDFVVE